MKVYLGSDHRGFELKQQLKSKLIKKGYQVEDLGNDRLDPQDDYVDFAIKVARKVTEDKSSRGVLLCGSGAGVDIVANKLANVRSALAFDLERAKQARLDDDANILSLPADVLTLDLAWPMVETFLNTDFSNEDRHLRRLKKLREFENQDHK